MFKFSITLTAIIFLSINTIAQITVGTADMPSLNDTVRFSTSASSVTALTSQSGTNQIWDASNLVPNFQDIANYKSISSLGFLYLATFSSSSYGILGQSALNLGGLIQASDVANFYKKSSSYYINEGRGFSVQGIPLSQTWKDTVYRFPLNYGDMDSSSYTSNEVNAVIATIHSTGKRINIVDGWGTITTPFGTFDCIRVKSTIRTTDTLKTSLIPISIPATQNSIEYKWIANGLKIPVLEISVTQGLGAQTTVKYRDVPRPEAFADLAKFTLNKASFQANLNTDTCKLTDNSTRNPVSRSWTITPSTFQYTAGTNANSQQPRIFFTAPGLYTVSLNVNYSAGSDDTTRVDVITVGTGPLAGFTANTTSTNTTSIVQFTDTSQGNPTSWLWSFNPSTVSYVGGTSADSQNPKVIFDNSGMYTVSLTVTNSIGSDNIEQLNYINCFTTGIVGLNVMPQLKVYPNPANNFIAISSESPITKVLVLDLLGKTIFEGNTTKIETQALTNGTYFLQIKFDNGYEQRQKFLVIH